MSTESRIIILHLLNGDGEEEAVILPVNTDEEIAAAREEMGFFEIWQSCIWIAVDSENPVLTDDVLFIE